MSKTVLLHAPLEFVAPTIGDCQGSVSDGVSPVESFDTKFGCALPSRILIADDHEAIRKGLRTTLTAAGWQICGEAANGKEAVEIASDLHPDLVILDISMPVMGGLEAAREILKRNQSVKIVVFTMHESQQMKDEMTKIGVHAVAVKSAPIGDLLGVIKSLLEK